MEIENFYDTVKNDKNDKISDEEIKGLFLESNPFLIKGFFKAHLNKSNFSFILKLLKLIDETYSIGSKGILLQTVLDIILMFDSETQIITDILSKSEEKNIIISLKERGQSRHPVEKRVGSVAKEILEKLNITS